MLRRVVCYIVTGFIKRMTEPPSNIIILVVRYHPDRYYFVTDCAADKMFLYKMRLFASNVANSAFVYNFNKDVGCTIETLISIYNPKRRRNRKSRFQYGKLDDIPFDDKRCGDMFKRSVRRSFDRIIKEPAVI